MDERILRVLVVLGIPGVALGIFYLLLRRFDFQFETITSTWAAIIALVFLVIAGGVTLFALNKHALQSTILFPRQLAFEPAKLDETLIVIATFHSTTATNSEPHIKIRRAIEIEAKNQNEQKLRVGVEPTKLDADQRLEAEGLGKHYHASMVIWGEDTGVEIIVNFLSLKATDFFGNDAVTITETEHSLLANPSAYAHFITSDLPKLVTFLALYAVGLSYYLNGKYASAIERIEAAIAHLSPEMWEGPAFTYVILGWLYTQPPNQLEKAIASYNQAIALDSNNSIAYNNRGLILKAQGKFEEAVADYTQAIILAPDSAVAYYNRGMAYQLQRKLEEAVADFDQAIALNPNDAIAYHNRGKAYLFQRKLEEAVADYTQAITLAPDFAAAYHNRGKVYQLQRKLEEAVADFDQAIALAPSLAEAYDGRGLVRQAQGKLEDAVADYTQAITLAPDFAAAYYDRGKAYLFQRKLEEAVADFDQAIALAPSLAEAYSYRGLVRQAQGKLEDAVADLDQAIALDLNNVGAYFTRGLVRQAQGKLEDAVADFDQAITLHPDFAEAYYSRSIVREAQGKSDAAFQDYNKAVQLDPNYA